MNEFKPLIEEGDMRRLCTCVFFKENILKRKETLTFFNRPPQLHDSIKENKPSFVQEKGTRVCAKETKEAFKDRFRIKQKNTARKKASTGGGACQNKKNQMEENHQDPPASAPSSKDNEKDRTKPSNDGQAKNAASSPRKKTQDDEKQSVCRKRKKKMKKENDPQYAEEERKRSRLYSFNYRVRKNMFMRKLEADNQQLRADNALMLQNIQMLQNKINKMEQDKCFFCNTPPKESQ